MTKNKIKVIGILYTLVYGGLNFIRRYLKIGLKWRQIINHTKYSHFRDFSTNITLHNDKKLIRLLKISKTERLARLFYYKLSLFCVSIFPVISFTASSRSIYETLCVVLKRNVMFKSLFLRHIFQNKVLFSVV